MKHRFSLLCVVASVWAAAPASAADDWQYWNQLAFRHKFSDRLALTWASEQKWRDDFSDLYLYNTTIVPTVSLAKGVSFGAGYRWEQKEDGDDWATEHRLLLPLAFTWTLEPWTLQWRNQTEYRDLEDTDRWRLRERILIQRPVWVGQCTITPFASGEVFYDFTDRQINQNRLTVGLSLPVREHVNLSVFYVNKADKDGDWSAVNVLGTELTLEF